MLSRGTAEAEHLGFLELGIGALGEGAARVRADGRLEVALGLLKAQIVNQVDAPLDAWIEAAHVIGGLVRPGG